LTAVDGKSQPLRAAVVAWLMRLDEAPCDASLRAEFEAWLAESDRHRAAYAAVEPVWRASADLAPPSAMAAASLSRDGRAPPRRVWRRVAVAAAGAMALAVAFHLLPVLQTRLQADHVTGVAEQRDVTLEDGSRVALDAGSAIAVRYGAARREIDLLAGEAFFQVTPGRARPFVVRAGDVVVTVTGTAFSVGVSDSETTVAVQSGSVDVARRDGALVAAGLVRGEWLQVASEGRVARGRMAEDEVASWRDRRLVVYDMPVRDVVRRLGRYRQGVVVFLDEGVAGRLVSGVIDLRDPDEALRALVDLQQGSIVEITRYLSVVVSR